VHGEFNHAQRRFSGVLFNRVFGEFNAPRELSMRLVSRIAGYLIAVW
jgi:hypothetical protein